MGTEWAASVAGDAVGVGLATVHAAGRIALSHGVTAGRLS
jgi:hypothetical protein